MSILVFDIETIPDVVHGRQLFDLGDLSDEDAAQAMFALRRAKAGNDFLPHYLQKIIAISLLLSNGSQVTVWSLGDEQSSEKELIQRFFSGLDKHMPTLVSWNGTGFDLPVLHYRALLHGIEAPTYWETGENQSSFKWNNYINRYHYRHLDLMDVLSGYQGKAVAPLDHIASLLGFPGKMGMSGDKVFEQFLAGNIKGIRDYCETDVLNTYCVYLRFELLRGNLTQNELNASILQLQNYLAHDQNKSHFLEFLHNMQT